MKRDLSSRILESLAEIALNTADLIAVLSTAPYGSSHKTLKRNVDRRVTRRDRDKSMRAEKQRYYNLLYKLESEHLIEKTKDRKLITTVLGKTWLGNHKKNTLPPTHYETISSDRWTIVAFDISEKERRKRDWLRAVLRNLELSMIQRSVWIGKIKLPSTFMDDVRKLGLLSSIEIFEITKAGTLKHIA